MKFNSKSNRRIITIISFLMLAFAVASFVAPVWAQEAAPAAGGAAAAAPPAGPQVKTTTVWTMIKHGGPTLLVLLLCSIYTLTLIIERYMFYKKAAGNSAEILDKVKQAGTLSEALTAVETAPGVSGRIMRMALQTTRDGYPAEQVEKLVEGEVTKELIGMEKYLPQLDSMVTMCPLIGLFGTTVGMIRSFAIVSAMGMSDPSALAGGISEALVNTASGLGVAIPALFAYNWFTSKKEMILMDMEKGLSELMVILKSSSGHEH
jgi:biopolymer transport protein ExbB